jgi:hypothetical protein
MAFPISPENLGCLLETLKEGSPILRIEGFAINLGCEIEPITIMN